MQATMKCRAFGLVLVAIVALTGSPAVAKNGEKVVKLKLGPFKIEPERDREVCQAIEVPGVAGMEVAQWEARSRVTHRGTTGSHHLVLYGYSGTESAKFPKELVDNSAGCADFGPADFFKARVFLSGSGGENTIGKWSVQSASYPGDLAQVMPQAKDDPGDSWVVINSHYFNDSRKVGRGIVKLKLWLKPLDPRSAIRQVTHGDASVLVLAPGTKSDPANNPITRRSVPTARTLDRRG
jgi:hypothetical protein